MADGVKLTIRPPPHADFVREYPGVPANLSGTRPGAHIQGTVEVRTKSKGVKALWLRLELRKSEIIPGGKDRSRYREHIGQAPLLLWEAHTRHKRGTDHGYDTLLSNDFPFIFGLPDGLPPSVLVDRKMGIGISYDLVCILMTKPKSGLFSNSSNKAPERIEERVTVEIIKHELLAGWPIYDYKAIIEDRRDTQNDIHMHIKRETTAYGPGDTIAIRVKLRSERSDPVKLSRIELVLKEVITFKGDVNDPNSLGEQLTYKIVEARNWINKILVPQEETSPTVKGTIPKEHARVSVLKSKHCSIVYHIGVRAVFEKDRATTAPIGDLSIDFLPAVIGSLSREDGCAEIAKICAGSNDIPEMLASPSPLPLRTSLLGERTSSSGTLSTPQQDQVARTPIDQVGGFRLVNGSPSPPISTQRDSTSIARRQLSDGSTTQASLQSDESSQLPRQFSNGGRQRIASNRQRQSLHQAQNSFSSSAPLVDEPLTVLSNGFVSAEEEKAEMIRRDAEEAARSRATEPDAHLRDSLPALPVPPMADRVWPTAEEEKQRYAAAMHAVNVQSDTQTEHSQRASHSDRTATWPPSPHPFAATSDFASAEREKQRLYEEAVAARPAERAQSMQQPTWADFGRSEAEKEMLYAGAVQQREEYDGPYAEPAKNVSIQDQPLMDPQRWQAAQAAQDAYERAVQEMRPSAMLPAAPTMPAPPRRPLADTSSYPTADAEKARMAANDAQQGSSSHESPSSLLRSLTISSVADEQRLYEQAVRQREKRRSETASSRAPPPMPPVSPRQVVSSDAAGRAPIPPQASRPYSVVNDQEHLSEHSIARGAMADHRRGPSIGSYEVETRKTDTLRRPSTAESNSSGVEDEPRDPAIALGKRRADPPALEIDSLSLWRPSERRGTYDSAFAEQFADADSPMGPASPAPQRPAKTPLTS